MHAAVDCGWRMYLVSNGTGRCEAPVTQLPSAVYRAIGHDAS